MKTENLCILYDKSGRIRHAVELLNYIKNGRGDLLLLEVAGSSVATRAIWANIIKSRAARSRTYTETHIKTEDEQERVSVIPGEKFHKLEKDGRLMMIHEDANKFNRLYIFGKPASEEPPRHFADALQLVELPFTARWTRALWNAGKSAGLITEYKSATGAASAYYISRNAEKWQRILKVLHERGELTDKTD